MRTFTVNIERNTGFDDDGEVADDLTAQAGTKSDEHDFDLVDQQRPVQPACD